MLIKQDLIEEIKKFPMSLVTGAYLSVSGDKGFFFQKEYYDEQLMSIDYEFLELTLDCLHGNHKCTDFENQVD